MFSESSPNIANPPPNPAQVARSRRTLLLLLGCFMLPVGLAYLALNTGWYKSQGLSNRGELIHPPAQIEALFPSIAPSAADRALWQWVYPLPEVCDLTCENRLIQIRQALIAVGPERDRVGVLLLAQGSPDQKINDWLETTTKNESKIWVSQLEPAQRSQGLSQLRNKSNIPSVGALYLMDPQGRFVLAYPPATDEAAWVQAGKSLLKDLKHLLKVSRIG